MKKYIIEYDLYDELVDLLGPNIPHSNLENVSTVIVDLTKQEYEALIGAGIYIIPNHTNGKLLGDPPSIGASGTPAPVHAYTGIATSHAAGFNGSGVNVAYLGTGLNDLHVGAAPSVTRINFTSEDISIDSFNHESRFCLISKQTHTYTGSTTPGTPLANGDGGSCYGANVWSLKCFQGGIASIIDAINWCISNNIHIISTAFDMGSGLETAITAAMNAGIIVVAAAGNTTGGNVAHPANIAGVLTVGVTAYNVPGTHLNSHVTNDGSPKVDVCFYNRGHVSNTGGTSQAAAMITACYLAIYKQKYPSLNTQKAKRLLQRRAMPLDLYSYTVDGETRGVKLNYETGAGFAGTINT